MGSIYSKNNNNIKNENIVKIRKNSYILEEQELLVFKLKNTNDNLIEKNNKIEDQIKEIDNKCKVLLKINKKDKAKILIAKKKILKKFCKKRELQIIMLDKRILQIKHAKSDIEVQGIIKDTNNCLSLINNSLDNNIYLEAKDLLDENEQLNNEAIKILENEEEEFNINKELNDMLNLNINEKKQNNSIKKSKKNSITLDNYII